MKNAEEYLLKGLKEGRESAFRELFDKYYHRLFCIARQYLQDDFTAETIVGDLFYHLWETRKSLCIQTSLNAYLVRSIRNYCFNYLQKNYVKKEVNLQGVSPLFFVTDEYPLGVLLEKELVEKVRDEIEKLPAETRRVFILSRIEELTNPEIAERIGISVNTVKYHIKQALSLLRISLKDYMVMIVCVFDFF
ncbi:MAG: RNA polymerase sigma-70 factor [Tannerellaceae bacterium]|nr:RNA polymerase sigma-70 factor [Tannerellaceae bacterium]